MFASLVFVSVVFIALSSVILGNHLRRRPLRFCRPSVLGSLAVMVIAFSLPLLL